LYFVLAQAQSIEFEAGDSLQGLGISKSLQTHTAAFTACVEELTVSRNVFVQNNKLC